MARVFVVATREGNPDEASERTHLGFGGEYFFLHPDILKLAAETDQRIDPQGNAWFQDTDLSAFQQFVAASQAKALLQPAEWNQRVGQSASGEPVLHKVSRARLMRLLDGLSAAADEASSIAWPSCSSAIEPKAGGRSSSKNADLFTVPGTGIPRRPRSCL